MIPIDFGIENVKGQAYNEIAKLVQGSKVLSFSSRIFIQWWIQNLGMGPPKKKNI
jgi:hypothetical protein